MHLSKKKHFVYLSTILEPRPFHCKVLTGQAYLEGTALDCVSML